MFIQYSFKLCFYDFHLFILKWFRYLLRMPEGRKQNKVLQWEPLKLVPWNKWNVPGKRKSGKLRDLDMGTLCEEMWLT